MKYFIRKFGDNWHVFYGPYIKSDYHLYTFRTQQAALSEVLSAIHAYRMRYEATSVPVCT